MAAGDLYFVEWKEQFVSKERGNRVVHYFLKDSSGESLLAVVGTERSVRHMFYVVSEEFLNSYGAENSIHAGFRWRSRREVVNWLTSMLSKQHTQTEYARSPRQDPDFTVDVQHTQMRESKGRLARNIGSHPSDIVWSGESWPCGKQLKHFPAFCRNGITIGIHSFVYVMAENENRYLAYLEDMYEDRKAHKKVKVRWFHYNREVQGVVSLRNPHPKEVFITPYAQVISAECVDGPAIVLTREHFEKCVTVFPNDLLARAHFCFRQFKSHRVKPFKLSKLRGYFDQPIFSCFSPDFFEDEELSSGDEVKIGGKRTRSGRENLPTPKKYSCDKLQHSLLPQGMDNRKHAEDQYFQSPIFHVNDKIEVLCLDSGLRGCWFRCTVAAVSSRRMKVRYDDIEDEDSGDSLEEWIPAFRLAGPDKFGMRFPERPTIRPPYTFDQADALVKVGSLVDAWWADGWWEGVVTGNDNTDNDNFQVYVPSENLLLNVDKEKLRISRDWIGDRWVDVDGNPDILSILSAILSLDSKVSASSANTKEGKSDGSPISCPKVPNEAKLSVVFENQCTVSACSDPHQESECEISENAGKDDCDLSEKDNNSLVISEKVDGDTSEMNTNSHVICENAGKVDDGHVSEKNANSHVISEEVDGDVSEKNANSHVISEKADDGNVIEKNANSYVISEEDDDGEVSEKNTNSHVITEKVDGDVIEKNTDSHLSMQDDGGYVSEKNTNSLVINEKDGGDVTEKNTNSHVVSEKDGDVDVSEKNTNPHVTDSIPMVPELESSELAEDILAVVESLEALGKQREAEATEVVAKGSVSDSDGY